MFGYGLAELLQQEPDIEIVGHETNVDQALKQIKKLQPDVIILERDNAPSNAPAMVLARLLNENLEATVILLSLQNNRLFVYMTAQWLAKTTDDLMMAVRQKTPAYSATYLK
jgi:DNA-binding NarL/FixJ family response regulator